MSLRHTFAPIPARYSLRLRLPIMISVLVALVMAAGTWTSYQRVKATLIETAGHRAQAAADQVANLLNSERSVEQLRQLGSSQELRQFLETRTDAARAAADARLRLLATSTPRRIELWDAAGSRLIEISVPDETTRNAAAIVLPPGSVPSEIGISPIQGSDDLVFIDSIAEIRGDGGASRRLGYLRIRSTFRENPPGIFARLVGHDAVVRVGNRAGAVWTDFSRVVPVSPVDLSRPGVAQYRAESGETRLGAVSHIAGTPWAAWVEFPLPTIVAPVSGFLSEMIVIAFVVVGVAAALATLLASRITKPLSDVHAAAAAIAAGDYSRRVTAMRRDEIGELGRTFNVMASDVASAADALRHSEERYRLLFASNPHPMWVYDVETLRFLHVNEMAVVHYGYSRDEFLAMTIKDIRPETELAALLDNVAKMSSQVETSGAWKHRKKDGTIIDVEIRSHELVLDDRRARVVLAHDVTDRLKAERRLQESEALFRAMAETMPHIVWTARPDGGFEYLNHRWFDYSGLSLEDTRREGWQLVLHPDDRERTIETRTHAFESGTPYEIPYRLKRRQDGVYRWHIGRAAPLRDERGAIVMWVGTSTDVDDARRSAEDLKALNAELESRVLARTAELEAANQELESFSYSVSHDLRAPLRHVHGYVEMLAAATGDQLSENAQRYLKTITDATTEMGELIDDLLDFSRIARAKMTEGPVALDGLVRSSINGLEMATRGRNINWTIEALPHVIGDPSMLKQVFANLIGNAVKYTKHRNSAEITIGCAGEEHGQHVLFVRDNGAGFDMRYADKLFGVFQRLHRADEFEGTGIGLATVRRIVNRHGGRTWAEGKVDGGATIYFTLTPVVGRAPAATAEHQLSKESA